MYADIVTDSMRKAIKEMERRRNKQIDYNEKHDITPTSIIKTHDEILKATSVADRVVKEKRKEEVSMDEITRLYKEMEDAVALLEFEQAAEIRDKIKSIKRKLEKYEGRKH